MAARHTGQMSSGARPRPGVLPPLVEPGPDLTRDQVERYSRHLLLPGIGALGQRRLAAARVLVIGAGGLGSPVLTYLAAAGVGTIGIVDDDLVDVSNLQRQVVHGADDVGSAKVDSAAQTLAQINPLIRVEQHQVRLVPGNALDMLRGYDLVLDGTDTFSTRYLISDACAVLDLPCVWGSVYRFDGQVSVFWSAPVSEPAGSVPPITYRDVHPAPPPAGTVPSCAEGGVLGVVCAAIGAAMATEAVKLICGVGEPLLGRLMIFDALASAWRTIGVRRSPDAPRITSLAADYDAFCGLPPQASDRPASDQAGSDRAGSDRAGSDRAASDQAGSDQADAPAGAVTVGQLAGWLAERDAGGRDFLLVDVREPSEREIASIPGAVSIPLAQVRSDPGVVLAQAAGRPIVLHCKSGARSAQALALVAAAGGLGAVHVLGGVLAWTEQIDPSQPRY
jgi:sulfur-carrier protein adenylyltransferase/sulfurtransferase